MIDQTSQERKSLSPFFVPALGLAYFSSNISNSIVSLLAVDIAKTYLGSTSGTSVGITSQLNTFNGAATVVFALLLSFLALRFRHNRLFFVGVVFVIASAIGSFFAPTLLVLQLFFALEGAGSVMIWIMATTLIGDYVSPEKKGKALSCLIGIGSFASLLSVFLVSYIANAESWQANYLLLVLPFSAASLVIASIFLPKKSLTKPDSSVRNPYFSSFRQIFSNKSAIACLVTNLFTLASGQIALFAIAYYRTQFLVPREWTSGIMSVALVIFVVSPLISGRLINRFGPKRLSIVSTTVASFCLLMIFFVSNMWVAFAFDMLHVWFGAFSIPAFLVLVLEQNPNSRGTMMALNSLFNNIGKTIAPAIGGALLVVTSGYYGSVGIVFGGLSLIGAVLLFFFVKETKKTAV
jgi:predicted MFS family arabinose efflux permease